MNRQKGGKISKGLKLKNLTGQDLRDKKRELATFKSLRRPQWAKYFLKEADYIMFEQKGCKISKLP